MEVTVYSNIWAKWQRGSVKNRPITFSAIWVTVSRSQGVGLIRRSCFKAFFKCSLRSLRCLRKKPSPKKFLVILIHFVNTLVFREFQTKRSSGFGSLEMSRGSVSSNCAFIESFHNQQRSCWRLARYLAVRTEAGLVASAGAPRKFQKLKEP